MNASYFCTSQTQRNLPGVFCCTPQNSDQLRLLVTTPSVGEQEIKFWDKKGAKLLEKEKKVVYLAHGFLEKIANSPWINKTRDGYLKRDYATVVVDWGRMNQVSYWQAMANLRTVGSAMGASILEWNVAEKALVVGLSLGGQIVGEAGKYVNQHGGGKQIAECHGLDPAGPWFDPAFGFLPDMELDKSDCKIVQVVHTSASYNQQTSLATLPVLKLGTAFKSGHCDFWVNCGHSQGDLCHGDIDLKGLVTDVMKLYKDGGDALAGEYLGKHLCSHVRSALMYADAVNNNCPGDKYPIGTVCENCGPGLPSPFGNKHDCSMAKPDGTDQTERFPPDNVCTPNDDVNFVVYSTDFAPFCQGKQ